MEGLREILPLASAVLGASLLGSMHCAGMCGAFLAMAVGPGERAVSAARLQGAYHAGRLLTYSALGASAGSVGAAVDLAGKGAGLSRVAAVIAGAMMAGFGAVSMLRLCGVRVARVPVPGAWQRLVGRGHRAVMDRPPLARAFGIGLLTTLLPCGWLYAFAITAAGTGSATLGAMVMGVFWLGTLPVLVAMGVGVTRLAGPLRRHAPLVTSSLLVVVGLITVLHRSAVPAFASGNEPVADVSVERVRALDEITPPCCRDGPGVEEGPE